MCKLAAWGLTATLVMGLGAAVTRAAEDETEGGTTKPTARTSSFRWSPWVVRAFRLEENKATARKPPPKAEKSVAKKPKTGASKPAPAVDEAAAERDREETILIRRLAACDKLKEIAIQRNDSELLRRAEEMDERARTAYAQRTVSWRDGESPFESDEKILEKHLGPGSTGRASPAIEDKDRGSRAVKEVNP
jgi:hypothetical protein